MNTADPIDSLARNDAVALACEATLVRLGAKELDCEALRARMVALEHVSDPERGIRAEVIAGARELVRGWTLADELEKALAVFDWVVEAAFSSERGKVQ